MTPAARTAWPAEGAGLLEPSISYALGVALAVTPELLSRPTPCREWDLRMLLRHACESLAAFGEGIEAGRVGLDPAAEDGDVAADPARAFRDRAGQLLDAWTGPGHQREVIDIAGCPLAASLIAATAALEVAVHGWDISRACGQRQPIPRALAADLLATAPVLVPRAGRHPLFAAPVAVAATAGPSDRLAALHGRSPGIAPMPGH
ncbi:MAG: TIGR03086 family metal-binding protein [Streptosporangiaceae bacterium]